MKIEKSLVTKIVISDIKSLDPISVYLEDYNKGQGKLIITCFDKSWTYYWGAMGNQNLAEFILSADNHYLSKKLAPNTPSDINDDDNMEEHAKKHIIERRKHDEIRKEIARSLYDDCYKLTEEFRTQENTEYSNLMYDIFGDEWYDCLPTKPNPDYQYFCRILDVVKEALKENTK